MVEMKDLKKRPAKKKGGLRICHIQLREGEDKNPDTGEVKATYEEISVVEKAFGTREPSVLRALLVALAEEYTNTGKATIK